MTEPDIVLDYSITCGYCEQSFRWNSSKLTPNKTSCVRCAQALDDLPRQSRALAERISAMEKKRSNTLKFASLNCKACGALLPRCHNILHLCESCYNDQYDFP